MILLIYLILSLVLGAGVLLSRSRGELHLFGYLFYGMQIAVAVLLCTLYLGDTQALFFTFDQLGALLFLLMGVVALLTFIQSREYLDEDSLRVYKLYHIALGGLCVALGGVYFSNNIAVTWIFLEATTLFTAGLVYHRRENRNLEATWKYVFVCSTGIAVAYLGVLLLSTVASELSYESLAAGISSAYPLYLKIAFLFILAGYSSKLEVFPLYSVGVDANYSSPTPASALISSALVNAGFVAIYRVYCVLQLSEAASWVRGVMLLAGLLSILIGALYLRRTNNYKRFFSYSTVENMGIVLVGLGIGGIGVFAALFHLIMHTLLKAGLFFNLAQVGRIFGSYRINRIGGYVRVSRLGVGAFILGVISLLAFPPSALFVSEMLIFRHIVESEQWWLLVVLVLLLCVVIYTLGYRVMQLSYKPVELPENSCRVNPWMSWASFLLILTTAIVGLTQPVALLQFISDMIPF